MARLRICDVAEAVLRETDNPAVMWGDQGLLEMIAERCGIENPGFDGHRRQQRRVLAALSRQPGNLIASRDVLGNGRLVRCFRLPED